MGDEGRGDKASRVAKSLGMSRRDLLRRTAILGGTMAWVTPAIQSVARPAYASTPSERDTSCCACRKAPEKQGPLCMEDFTLEDCQAFCGDPRNFESYLAGGECDSHGNCVPIAS
jgi:hypothetical protein